MQIVLNPRRVSLSNLCPWAASWVGCREELQQGKVADSRLLALLWSLALPAGTHLQLNRPARLTDCLATLTVLNTTRRERTAVIAVHFDSASHWMTPVPLIFNGFPPRTEFWFFFFLAKEQRQFKSDKAKYDSDVSRASNGCLLLLWNHIQPCTRFPDVHDVHLLSPTRVHVGALAMIILLSDEYPYYFFCDYSP